MTFNEKLCRHQGNLDAAHDALLDSGDREETEKERQIILRRLFGPPIPDYFLKWKQAEEEIEKLRKHIDGLNELRGKIQDEKLLEILKLVKEAKENKT